MATTISWIVSKFGGTSVRDRGCWENITKIVENHLQQAKHVCIVCSAPSKVSDLLDTLIQSALIREHQHTLSQITTIYQQLANDLDVDIHILHTAFTELQQYCDGIALLGEATPRIRARIMAFGELMLTQLGYHYLQKHFDSICWQDARTLLKSQADKNVPQINYLNGYCDSHFDIALVEKFNQLQKKIIITQGFIASDAADETVLLGRGGSDTSAAYFAAKLAATACEIWTDVPGVYTANPHVIPEARLLKQLDYAEVQEIASLGAKILHPNCIPPLAENKIPLFVKYTQEPERIGTNISFESDNDSIPIKSIISRLNVILISIESINMWKQSGFLVEVFACFKKYNLSVDLISTSESNITVSLDPISHQHNPAVSSLLQDLNKFTTAKTIGPCASISLVGRHIRAILPQISHLFAVFNSQKIYLLSQAANDLNLTFVVDEEQAERLCKKLHVLLVEQNPKSVVIGKSWIEEYGKCIEQSPPWWQQKHQQLLVLTAKQSPLYVYDSAELAKNADNLLACTNINKIFYAMKANPHPDILQLFYNKGINFECVSLGEVNRVLELFPTIDPDRILFTPNFAPKSEYEVAIKLKIRLTIDSLFPLQHWPELFANHSILLRLDPGEGSGHHKYVNTAGTESKFGIPLTELATVAKIAETHQIEIIGLHAHCGSGILQADIWKDTAKLLASYIELFPQLKIIDIGGGLGVVEKPGQKPLDLPSVNQSLNYVRAAYPHLEIWMEPGRYLVATSGVLLAKVTQIKQKDNLFYIGIETGMNSLIRPALYGAYHEIVNLSKLDQPKTMLTNIVGPICESGDTLGYSRLLPTTEEGDILLIAITGAYGHSMSSHYNLREPAIEYFLR